VLRDVTDLVQTQELLLARARSLAVQETRRQLARHLHDNVTQTLAAIRLRLEVAAAAAQGGLDPSQVHELQDGLGQAIRELRQTMWELRPTVLEKLPFAQALRAYLEDLGSRSGFRARLEVEGRVDLQPEREVLLFRVVQEAVTNALKHSQAEEVLVRLEARDGHLAVEIRDDGVGFDVQAAGVDPLRKSFGLRDMQDRARVLGSELLIRSDPGHGTRVSLSVPREPRQEALQ
jgi:signal transduction histidine kinase